MAVSPHDRWVDQAIDDPSAWPTGPLLLFGPAAQLERLRPELPQTAICIAYASAESQVEIDHEIGHKIDPQQPDAVTVLFAQLQLQGLPAALVLLASAEAEDGLLPRDLQLWIQLGQYLLKQRLQRPLPLLYVLDHGNALGPQQAAIAAFLLSLAQEHAKLPGKCIQLDADSDLAPLLRAELGHPRSGELRYRGGRRQLKGWRFAPPPAEEMALPLRQQGVYLISGGAGAVGSLLAQQLLERLNASVIVCGRSPAGHPQLSQRPGYDYQCVDVSDADAVTALIERIKAKYGTLHGLIHAAGVLDDAYLRDKPMAAFQPVLRAKISGLRHLDRATQGLALDFFVCLSSLAAQLGSAGQTDYAYANRFMDEYMQRRVRRAEGLSLSLNLPLIAAGGMAPSPAMQAHQARLLGAEPLSSDNLWRGFSLALAHAAATTAEPGPLLLFQAEPQRLAAYLGMATTSGLDGERLTSTGPDSSAPEYEASLAGLGTRDSGLGTRYLPGMLHSDEPFMNDCKPALKQTLRALVADLLHLDLGEIEEGVELFEYGFDSINFAEFSNLLNDRFGLGLNPSIFFEYPTLASLAAGLLQDHAAAMQAYFAGQPGSPLEGQHESTGPVGQPLSGGDPGWRCAPAGPASAPCPGPEVPEAPAVSGQRDEPMAIAIVGLAARLPQAVDAEAFWHNLLQAPDMISEVPAERWDWRRFAAEQGLEQAIAPRWGGFMPDIDQFDAGFFRISHREARLMDPQHRLFLQCAWHAIEDSGTDPERLRGSDLGVFVGVSSSEYARLLDMQGEAFDPHIATGLAHSMLPNRLSYLLDLHGPSEALDTACSSSLVALCRALDALRNGDCSAALVGGVNLMLDPAISMLFEQGRMLSPDGRCRSFDAQAQGYVRGEGIGLIYLKPLRQAEADGDRIYALVRGHAVNHAGRTQSITAPSVNAQSQLIIKAWQRSGLDPRTASYIETHGTATALGDPVEINALKKAFQTLYRQADGQGPTSPRCLLGTVKANIGHLEAAAGIAGVIKVLLAMQRQTLPGHPHFQQLNPYISLEGSPFEILTQTQPWPRLQGADGAEINRRAGVSSFGFGGVNAHVVLEEYRAPSLSIAPESASQMVLLSAKDQQALRDYAQALHGYLDNHADLPLSAIAYTSQVGRPAFGQRLGILCDSLAQLQERLKAFVHGGAAAEAEGIYYADPPGDRLHGLLLEDEDAQDVLRETALRWFSKGKHANLLRLWVQGADLDWSACYSEPKPRRISLPGYPFRRQRHWIEPQGLDPEQGTAEPEPLSDLALRHYLKKIENGQVPADRLDSADIADEALLDYLKEMQDQAGAAE
ncbi:MAG: SDR family NAD(P)-dependent oxidoreductase [Gammaproteobacteria bacterium SHHR-1]